MRTFRKSFRIIVISTAVVLVVLTSTCGMPASDTLISQTPQAEVTNTSRPTDGPEATSTIGPNTSPEPPYNILFIGNSLTFWNNGLEHHLALLAGSANPPLVIRADAVVLPGAPLKTMWEETEAREVIAGGGYDVVILQGALPSSSVETFHEYTRKFVAKIRESEAEPVLFMTWPRGTLTMETIAQAYGDIARELDVEMAPVGFAWQLALEERPDLILTVIDKVHPSIHGSYLAVNVIYATIFGESPVGLTYLPTETNKLPSGTIRVTEDDAAFLQRIAWETVWDYQPHK